MFQPVIVTDDRHGAAATRCLFLGRKGAPLRRRNAQNGKIIRADDIGERATRFSLLTETDHPKIVRQHLREDCVLLANVAVGGIRKLAERFWILFVLRKELHNLRRLRVTGRLKQHRVDEAENGGVRANAKGENDHSRDGEPRRLHKLSDRKFKILDHMRLPVRCRRLVGWIQDFFCAGGDFNEAAYAPKGS